jgi:UDP-glucose 4-epimerase
MRVLVTGGAGYIGSHAVKLLLDQGHTVTVLDNLSHGHRVALDSRAHFLEGSTGNQPLVLDLLCSRQIEAVLHFAADIEVAESVADPGRYYLNNFANSVRLLEAMRSADVRKIVFSSTAAVYGNPERTPIEESAPRQPINPYGRSKLMTEFALEDFSRAHGLGFTILRYFNVAGAMPDGSLGEDHEPESHLIPRLLLAARDGGTARIYGSDYPTRDGTCVRDYVHVLDLAQAHLLALDRTEPGRGAVFNIGSESGFTVREVIATVEKVTGKTLKIMQEERRAGDPAELVASSARLRRELGWKPLFPELEKIVAHAWNWHCKHPRGWRG